MAAKDPLNELARLAKTAEITLRAYVTGVVAERQEDGSWKDTFESQWRCTVETDAIGEIQGRGRTPTAAVRTCLGRVKRALDAG